uniref:Uncharacterized protein n=1 Tax=Wuchereria bancrofti TaxID=6293 RepID=A0A1I8E8X3_WUCBA
MKKYKEKKEWASNFVQQRNTPIGFVKLLRITRLERKSRLCKVFILCSLLDRLSVAHFNKYEQYGSRNESSGLDASLFRLFGYVLCCECREPFTIPGSCQIC